MDTHCRAEALPHAPFADTRRAYSDRSPPPRHRPYGLEHGFDRASQNVHCACTHYLVFKEPAVPDARSARPAALPPTTTGRLQANLPRLPEGSHSVNPLSCASAALSNREERIGGTSVFGDKKICSRISPGANCPLLTCSGRQLRLAGPPTSNQRGTLKPESTIRAVAYAVNPPSGGASRRGHSIYDPRVGLSTSGHLSL